MLSPHRVYALLSGLPCWHKGVTIGQILQDFGNYFHRGIARDVFGPSSRIM
jgi:hypothetical protein